ncbi:MAG: hypothetical protein ACRYFA_06075 [Janthinobacterium lividum]
MPKNLNYPLASFQKAYALSEAVDALGGSCTVEDCALKMQRKISGGFMVIISSAQKFNLVSLEKSIITISEEYKLIKHSYTNTERMTLLRKSFLAPQVFSILYGRFKGRELPENMLDKILIREFGVEEITAGRVAGYFVEGLKTFGLLNGANVVEEINEEQDRVEAIVEVKPITIAAKLESKKDQSLENVDASFTNKKMELYELQLSGPGIQSKFTIEDEEDLAIAEAILKKIRKALKSESDEI